MKCARLRQSLLFALLLLLLPTLSYGAATLIVDQDTARYDLTGYSDVLVLSAPVSIEALLEPSLNRTFRPSELGDFSLRPDRAQTWFRFTLHNPGDHPLRRLLEVGPSKLNHHQFYANGQAVPLMTPEVALRPRHIYPVDIAAGATETFYVAIRSQAPLQLSLSLYSYDGLMTDSGRQFFFNSVMLGVMATLALYCLLSAVALRESLFAIVAVYCGIMAVGELFAWGYLGGRMEGMLPPWQNELMPMMCQAVIIAELLFALRLPIYATDTNSSPWRRVLQFAVVANLTGMAIFGIGNDAVTTTLTNVLTATTLLLLPVVALYGYLQTGSRLVLWYLLVRSAAFTVYLLTWLSYTLELIDEATVTATLTLAIAMIAASHITLLHARRHKLQLKREKEAIHIAVLSEANRTRSDTLARVTHDIRTPISAILGVADLLEDTHLTGNQREYLHSLQRSSHELLKLMDETGQAALHQDNTTELHIEPVALNELIESTLTGFRNMAAEQTVDLVSDIDPHLPARVLADPSRLKQLLTHTVISAFEHSEGGDIVLRVTGRTRRVHFELSHWGQPFDRQERQALDRRREGSDDYNSRFAIIAQLVGTMGGHIQLSGSGLRRYRMAFDLALEPARDDGQAQDKTSLLRDRCILVANAQQTFCDVIAQQCRNWGMDVLVAHSEQSALAQLHNQALLNRGVDFLLIDSGFDDRGLSLASRMQDECEQGKPRPCCLLTAFANTHYQRHELQGAGVQRVLSKPIGSGALHNALCGEQHAANTKAPTLSTYSSDSLAPRPMHCLMAEDNPTNAQVLKRMLKALKISVRHVENGQQAVNIYMREHFDFVVMDIEMPILDGEEATRQIRQFEADEQRERTPIFGLTANAMDEQRDRYLRAGMDLHLVKPIRLWELAEAIKRWTGYHREQS